MDSKFKDFIFSTFDHAFGFMNPYLNNYADFSVALSKEIQDKGHENIQYSFDVELDKIFKSEIKKHQIAGKIYSEESKWEERGDKIYKVVYDPFCNSSLASRTFHEAAVGISIFSYEGDFLTSAIMDYGTGIVGLVEDNKTNFYQIQSKQKLEFNIDKSKGLDSAWVVITLENKHERQNFDKARVILDRTKRILISSGHIYWLKLAIGMVDGYLDPFGGELLYEMFACTVSQKAGCVITDLEGKIFDPKEMLKVFEESPSHVFYPVAAGNAGLHQELLVGLQK